MSWFGRFCPFSLKKICKYFIFAMLSTIWGYCIYYWRILVCLKFPIIYPFGFSLLPNVIIFQSLQSFLQLLIRQIQRVSLMLFLFSPLLLRIVISILLLLHLLICLIIFLLFSIWHNKNQETQTASFNQAHLNIN